MDLIIAGYQAVINSMTSIEIWATIFGLASVYLTVRQNIWCFPTGLVMVILYIFIFYDVKLYSEMILQVVYIFMSFYGWYYWLKDGERTKDDVLQITSLKNVQRLKWIGVWIVSTFLVGYMMMSFTDAALPVIDAGLAAGSIIAQWFLSKKILESWFIWVSLDVVFIFVFINKGLYLTAGLYMVFLFLATSGAIAWYKSKNRKLES